MQNITPTEQQRPRQGARKRKWRLSKKGKFRLFFVVLLLVLFGASYGITSLVLLSAPVSAEPPESDPETEPSRVEVTAPDPVTDPKLPHILSGVTATGNDEPVETPTEGEGETETEAPTEEDPSETVPESDPPNAEEPSAGEETPPAESRNEGLR